MILVQISTHLEGKVYTATLRCGARKTDRCTALTKLYCATEECKFYKTKEEYERQERREKNED